MSGLGTAASSTDSVQNSASLSDPFVAVSVESGRVAAPEGVLQFLARWLSRIASSRARSLEAISSNPSSGAPTVVGTLPGGKRKTGSGSRALPPVPEESRLPAGPSHMPVGPSGNASDLRDTATARLEPMAGRKRAASGAASGSGRQAPITRHHVLSASVVGSPHGSPPRSSSMIFQQQSTSSASATESPAHSPVCFSERFSPPAQSFERHSEDSDRGLSNEPEQTLEEKVREEIDLFSMNYGYLIAPSADGDVPVIPRILTYPHLRDRGNFTGEDVNAIRTFLNTIINSLLDLKLSGDIANLNMTRAEMSSTIKDYRNVLESYIRLRNSRSKNGRRKGAHRLPHDSSYKASKPAKPENKT